MTVITELAVERVEFTCGHCWNQWSLDYDIQRYRNGEGGDWEYFSRDGIAVASLYTPAGALPCPVCGRRWVGRILARRPILSPPGPTGTPRQSVTDGEGHRSCRGGPESEPESDQPPASRLDAELSLA